MLSISRYTLALGFKNLKETFTELVNSRTFLINSKGSVSVRKKIKEELKIFKYSKRTIEK